MFYFSKKVLQTNDLNFHLKNIQGGAKVFFEGCVREDGLGKKVTQLEYEAYIPLAQKEGSSILQEVKNQFFILEVKCVHRLGVVSLGEACVWVGVIAKHRKNAFEACVYIMDEIKKRVPIWKKEYYLDKVGCWV